MRKKYRSFIRRYWQFWSALLIIIISLGLQLSGLQSATHWLLGLASLALTIPLIAGVWRDFRDGIYGTDLLAITAIITAVFLHEYWVGILIIMLSSSVKVLEDFAKHRSQVELRHLLEQAPRFAHVIRHGQETDASAKEIRIGEKIIINPGEIVPVDAVIIEGQADFDVSSISDDSTLENKTVGQEIFSGSLVLNTKVTAKVSRPSAESRYAQVIRSLRVAVASRAPITKVAEKFAIPFTIVAFAIAGGAWLYSGDALRFLAVLVVATPYPLILAAPIALASGISRANKAGIIIKNGTALERLAKTSSMVFDKTGTLTLGELKVADVITFGKATVVEILGYSSSLERGSSHVLASAIIDRASQLKAKTYKTKNVQEEAGNGLAATIKGKQILVGRPDFLVSRGIEVASSALRASAENTSTFVAIDGELAGIINFEDEIRADGRRAIARLRSNGVHNIYLVTGGNMATARRVAKQVGIGLQQVVAGALPIDKLRLVEDTAKRPAAFIGDGTNDAPELVAADIGITFGAKDYIAASKSADIVIMHEALSRVADAHSIAIRTFSLARQSILIGTGLIVMLMLLFATGRFRPIYGVVLQEVVVVAAIFNALRAHTPAKKR